MMAKACLKCKEYVSIIPHDVENQRLIEIFDKNHKGHTLVVINFEEIRESFKRMSI